MATHCFNSFQELEVLQHKAKAISPCHQCMSQFQFLPGIRGSAQTRRDGSIRSSCLGRFNSFQELEVSATCISTAVMR